MNPKMGAEMKREKQRSEDSRGGRERGRDEDAERDIPLPARVKIISPGVG